MPNKIRMFVVVWAVIVACTGDPPVHAEDDKLTVPALDGFQCFLAPDSFNEPGTIFYVGSDKVAQFATVVRGTIDKGDIAIGTTSFQSMTSGGLIVELAKELVPGLSANANAKASLTKTRSVTITPIKKDAKERSGFDLKVNAVKWYTTQQKRGTIENATYYVVREAIRASSVSYMLDSGDVAALGAGASFERLAKAQAGVRHTDNGGYVLIQKFPSPLRVCIKPEALAVATRNLDGTPTTYTTAPVTNRIEVEEFKARSQD